jgi:hypothetical protein
MTDAAGGARLEAYVPRPTFGGPNGHLRIDVVLPVGTQQPAQEAAQIAVDGTAECKGVRRSVFGDLLHTELWKEGRRALEHIIEDAEMLLSGEEPPKRGWQALGAGFAGRPAVPADVEKVGPQDDATSDPQPRPERGV